MQASRQPVDNYRCFFHCESIKPEVPSPMTLAGLRLLEGELLDTTQQVVEVATDVDWIPLFPSSVSVPSRSFDSRAQQNGTGMAARAAEASH